MHNFLINYDERFDKRPIPFVHGPSRFHENPLSSSCVIQLTKPTNKHIQVNTNLLGGGNYIWLASWYIFMKVKWICNSSDSSQKVSNAMSESKPLSSKAPRELNLTISLGRPDSCYQVSGFCIWRRLEALNISSEPHRFKPKCVKCVFQHRILKYEFLFISLCLMVFRQCSPGEVIYELGDVFFLIFSTLRGALSKGLTVAFYTQPAHF